MRLQIVPYLSVHASKSVVNRRGESVIFFVHLIVSFLTSLSYYYSVIHCQYCKIIQC